MDDPSIMLLKHGFIKKKYKALYAEEVDWSKVDISTAQSHANEEIDEEVLESFVGTYSNPYDRTGYPKPTRRYRLIVEAFGLSMEETYFWILQHLRLDQGYPMIEKITDIFSASENSAFWGQSAQRLGLQQDKVTQYFATIGKMVKDLFQLVRELRIIDERIELYKWAPERKSADVSLKGLYIDLVEGGTEKPNSVYGLSQKVGFTILPDLFFNTKIYNAEKLDEKIDSMEYNPTVKNILKRKLFQFIIWKNKTQIELQNRRKFNLKYLRQHWGVIKMYMGWIKPYLKNIQRLSMSQKHMESPDIVTAFETSILEIEFLAKKQEIKSVHPCILASFKYTTKPTLSYQQEYQRGPIHVGRVEVNMRSYAWTKKEVENYKKMRNLEDMELLGIIDASVQAAMEELGEELNKYLEEAGEKIEKPKQEEAKKDPKKDVVDAFDPFVSVFKGFWEIFTSIIPVGSLKSKKKAAPPDPGIAIKTAEATMWQTYKNYKKSHKLVTW